MAARKKAAEAETKAEAPEKKAKTEAPKKWNTGKPEKPGLYNARVDGQETVLQFKVCPFNNRSYWMYVDGTDVNPSANVEWREGKAKL